MADRKRKSKDFYRRQAKLAKNDHQQTVQLSHGLRGFFITCNFNEYQCLKDSYDILNHVSDELYGPETGEIETGDQNQDNIEASIEAELETLKSKKARRFIQVKTKCQNVIFVRTNDLKVLPQQVVDKIFQDIKTSGSLNSRFIQRILPVDITFRANKDTIFEKFESYFDEHAPKEARKFSVMVKVRFNSDHPSETTLKEQIIKIVKDKRTGWTLKYDNPELIVVLNICITAACLSLLENYDAYSKYNPSEFHKKLEKANNPPEEATITTTIEQNNEASTIKEPENVFITEMKQSPEDKQDDGAEAVPVGEK